MKAIMTPPDTSRLQHMDRAQVEAALASISEYLKRPMSDTERAMEVMDRNDLRARLAELDARP